MKGGEPIPYDFKPTMADGIAGGGALMSKESIDLVKQVLDEVIIISEPEIAKAVRFLALENKLVVEGAGAIGLAAALAVPKKKRGRSACVLSGGSIDALKLAHILEET
jgi:threonine dehydratase